MISVLVPYRPDGGHRDQAWTWIAKRWAVLLPQVELVVANDNGGSNPGEFNHPLAINRAAKAAGGDVFLIADADTAFDPAWVLTAADMVATGEAPWVLPGFYDKFTQETTERILRSDPSGPIGGNLEWRGDSVSVSGLVMVSREGFERVGGYDERFAQWGADDVCFAVTMDNLVGTHRRLPGSAYHLWHPAPLGETYGHEDHRRQHELMNRYKRASGDPTIVERVRFG